MNSKQRNTLIYETLDEAAALYGYTLRGPKSCRTSSAAWNLFTWAGYSGRYLSVWYDGRDLHVHAMDRGKQVDASKVRPATTADDIRVGLDMAIDYYRDWMDGE